MIFTYFQLINMCSPYEFVDILMIEILKLVEKCKIYQNKGSQGSLRAGHLTKKICLGDWDLPCKFWRFTPGLPGGMVRLRTDSYIITTHEFYIYVDTETIFIPNIKLNKNTSKGNTFCITRAFGMVLISYYLISFHCACALFIQCFYI